MMRVGWATTDARSSIVAAEIVTARLGDGGVPPESIQARKTEHSRSSRSGASCARSRRWGSARSLCCGFGAQRPTGRLNAWRTREASSLAKASLTGASPILVSAKHVRPPHWQAGRNLPPFETPDDYLVVSATPLAAFAMSAATPHGTCESAMNAAVSGLTSAAKDARNFARSRNRKPSCGGRIGGTGAPGGGFLISADTDSPLSGANAAM